MGTAYSTHKRDDKCIQHFARNQGSKSSLPRPKRGWKDSIQKDHVTDSPCCNHQQRVANEVVSPCMNKKAHALFQHKVAKCNCSERVMLTSTC
jgi:hypothetical protein